MGLRDSIWRGRGIARRLLGHPRRDGYLGWHDPARVTMGRGSYGEPRLVCYSESSGGRVEIGNFCSIAAGVRFLVDGAHRADLITTSPLPGLASTLPPYHGGSKGPIRVGHDVWIGRDATIMAGVTIGTGAVIAACSVVVRDVPPYMIVGGNPAQVLRRRFSEEECEILLASRWWDWPDEKLEAAVPKLFGTDVRALGQLDESGSLRE